MIFSLAPEGYRLEEELNEPHQFGYIDYGIGALLLLLAIGPGISAYYAQQRKWMRRRALMGYADAMPLATITPDPEKAPDIVAPLEALWSVAILGVFALLLAAIVVFLAIVDRSPIPTIRPISHGP
jgi:peptidoglycan/LPS O-acetylase OafA/YrhL